MATTDGLAAVKLCNTYLRKLNGDGVLVESFDCGETWDKVSVVHDTTRWLQVVCGLILGDLKE